MWPFASVGTPLDAAGGSADLKAWILADPVTKHAVIDPSAIPTVATRQDTCRLQEYETTGGLKRFFSETDKDTLFPEIPKENAEACAKIDAWRGAMSKSVPVNTDVFGRSVAFDLLAKAIGLSEGSDEKAQLKARRLITESITACNAKKKTLSDIAFLAMGKYLQSAQEVLYVLKAKATAAALSPSSVPEPKKLVTFADPLRGSSAPPTSSSAPVSSPTRKAVTKSATKGLAWQQAPVPVGAVGSSRGGILVGLAVASVLASLTGMLYLWYRSRQSTSSMYPPVPSAVPYLHR